jgi:hypothetical protein
VKENLVRRKGGKAPKWDANIVPNEYWVTKLLPVINPNGKNNVTHNCGPYARWNVDQYETRTKNKKTNEDAAALATVAAAKKKDKNLTQKDKIMQKDKKSRKLIAVNRTRKAPAPIAGATKKRKKVSPLIKNFLKRRTCC